MNFNQVTNWKISDGFVARVTDSNNNIIWEKPRQLWITNYGGGACDTEEFTNNTVPKISYDNGTTWNDAENPDSTLSIHATSCFTIYPGRSFDIKLFNTNLDTGETEELDPGDNTYKVVYGLLSIDAINDYDTECNNWNLTPSTCTISSYEDNQTWLAGRDDVIEQYDTDPTRACQFGPTNVFSDLVLSISAGKTIYAEGLSWSLGNTESFTYKMQRNTFNISDPNSEGWSISSSASWISFQSESGTGSYSNNYVSVVKNFLNTSRTGTITLKNASGTIISTCTVTQGAATLPSWDLGTIKTITGEYDSTQTFSISISDPSEVGWSITAEDPYITFSSNSGNGNATVTATCSLSSTSQTTIIKLCGPASATTVISSCSVTLIGVQSAGTISWASGQTETYAYNSTSGTLAFTQNNAGTLSVSSSASWCTPSISGNTINLTFSQNTTSSTRSTTITLSGTNATSITKTIYQSSNSSSGAYTWDQEEVEGIVDSTSKTSSWIACTEAEMTTAGVDESQSSGWYRSDIYHLDYGFHITKIVFHISEAVDVQVDYYSDGETNYDYLVVSQLDEETAPTDHSTAISNPEITLKGSMQRKIKTKTYELTPGEHWIYVTYIKDGSVNSNTDMGYFKVH